MEAISISAELFREIGHIADNESYLAKVLDFVKTLTRKNSMPMHGVAYLTLLEQLSDFQEYGKGWDGANALPLNKTVVKNFKAMLAKSNDQDLSGWHISPEVNGTLLLQNEANNAGINLGTRDFSYFLIKGEDIEGANNIRFTPKALIDTIKKLNQ